MEWILGAGIFIAVACIFLGILLILRPKWDPESRVLEKRLEELTVTATETRQLSDIKKRRALSDNPRLHALLSKINVMHKLDELVVKANSRLPLGVFLFVSCILALCSFLILFLLTRSFLMPVIIGFGMGTTPFLYLLAKKRQRVAKFERQFPDAMDLMARSLRAGHAFSGGLQMVAHEFDEPIGPEFMKMINEINFGASVDQALKNMTGRVDMPDLKFFAVSVIIQRESGGNLADILENIARLVRERFKLLGKIKALSAEGRISAVFLIALPFAIVILLTLIDPGYLGGLIQDPLGRALVIIALCMMGLGAAIIKKMINIRV